MNTMKTRVSAVLLATLTAAVLAGCGGQSNSEKIVQEAQSSAASAQEHDHKMDGGPAPEGIREARNPSFPVGSEVTLTADHMMGMDGAPATIVGAYDTTVYAVDYEPTDGGEKVTDHKWVVQEELENAGDEPLQVGDTAVLAADHMGGMKGAEATIAEVSHETVYMVDYSAGGMTMKNHKWVTESEIEAK